MSPKLPVKLIFPALAHWKPESSAASYENSKVSIGKSSVCLVCIYRISFVRKLPGSATQKALLSLSRLPFCWPVILEPLKRHARM